MSQAEILYPRLPIPLQHIACSLEGWRIQRMRFSEPFPTLLREAESRAAWSAEQMQDYRDARLRAFVRHAADTVPYYRRRFRELGISPDDIRTLEDLRRLPILTRQEVQEHSQELISEAVPEGQRIMTRTSGTTGTPLRFPTTRRTIQEQWSIWWRYWRWHGLRQGTWCAHTTSRTVVPVAQAQPPFWRYNYPGHQIIFSSLHTSPEQLAAWVDELRRRRPPWLHGYPSVIALLAAYIVDSGADLGYVPRWVTLGADNVLPQQARMMEQAFGVRPRQHYGLAEGVVNVSECEQGSLHVDEDFAAVEFIPNPGGSGCRLVGTNMANPATPLIRYDTLDLATLAEGSCPCGRPGRLVASFDGRQNDFVIRSDGAPIHCLSEITHDITSLREVQIYQPRLGEVTIRIVRGPGYSQEDERTIMARAHEFMGNDMNVSIAYVASLPRTASGKLRGIVSDLPQAHYARLGARNGRGPE